MISALNRLGQYANNPSDRQALPSLGGGTLATCQWPCASKGSCTMAVIIAMDKFLSS